MSQVLSEVKKNWDTAVSKYTKQFDKLELENTLISKEQIQEAYRQVDEKDVDILREAAANIEFFAKEQFKTFEDFEVNRNGVILGQKIIPIEKVGAYVPGWRYPLPSSALMNVIPKK